MKTILVTALLLAGVGCGHNSCPPRSNPTGLCWVEGQTCEYTAPGSVLVYQTVTCINSRWVSGLVDAGQQSDAGQTADAGVDTDSGACEDGIDVSVNPAACPATWREARQLATCHTPELHCWYPAVGDAVPNGRGGYCWATALYRCALELDGGTAPRFAQ